MVELSRLGHRISGETQGLGAIERVRPDRDRNPRENSRTTRHSRQNVKRVGNPWRAARAAGGVRDGHDVGDARSNHGIHREAAETARRAYGAGFSSLLACAAMRLSPKLMSIQSVILS